MLRRTLCAAAALLSIVSTVRAEDDPYLWLEEVEGTAALDWVRDHNARSLKLLEADKRFKPMYDEALSILTSKARLPLGEIHNGLVYNFWQDDEHVRGLWRRASVESYRAGAPEWETVLDVDALAASEDRNWIVGTTSCLSPAYLRCMIELTDGGKDAGLWREFDTQAKAFVEGGFSLPEAKSSIAWLDQDTLLVSAGIDKDALTTSGYPRKMQRLARGEALDDAPFVFEGQADDVSVSAFVDHDGDKNHVLVNRAVSFFDSEFYYSPNADKFAKLPVTTNVSLQGVLDGRAIFLLGEAWTYRGETFEQGSVIAYDLKKKRAETVMTASQTQAINDVKVGDTGLIVEYLDDVSGAAARLVRDDKKKQWIAHPIALPGNGVIRLVSAGGGTDDALISYESLTAANTLYYVDAENGAVHEIMSAPAFYDAAGVVVEQRFATSKDGTKIPYYVMALDAVLKQGNAPTVQYGYGGFLNAVRPVYYEDPARPQHGALGGLMWVKRGGVLVLSNIRGGGEYGARWHEAALKENHQRSFDDFIAISEDLIETGVTTPQKLGAVGRSNGGLLMGAILTQRPDLYAALDIGVPLFDMKRYTKLGAGASWMGEYGDPDIPEQWDYISKYSPYQNLKAGEPYPKVLFYTSTKDDRVHPGHARKAAARMTELGYDYFYFENMDGGHSGTANQDELAYRTAIEYAYFAKMLMTPLK